MEIKIFLAFFVVLFFAPIVTYSIYFFNVYKEQIYRYKSFIENLNDNVKIIIEENNLNDVIKRLFDRVNGWCNLRVIYTIVHFCFNFWSIAYAVLALGMDGNVNSIYIKVCSIFSILTLALNLFLKSEKKWMTFKKVWIAGSKKTNSFIIELSSENNRSNKIICKIVEEYSNSILDIEKSLRGDDII